METTLIKGLALLEALASRGRLCGVSELAGELKLSKSNTHRLLNTLVAAGFCRGERGQYMATLKTWELGVRVMARFDVRIVARPVLERIAKVTGEGVRLAILDEARLEAVLIDAVECSQAVRAFTEIGARLPVHCTASGKALLLHQDSNLLERCSRKLKPATAWTVTDPTGFIRHIEKARKDGYVTSVREYEEQVSSIGVPILTPDGTTIASISIAAPAERMPPAILRDHAQLLRAAADQIRISIGRATPIADQVKRRRRRPTSGSMRVARRG